MRVVARVPTIVGLCLFASVLPAGGVRLARAAPGAAELLAPEAHDVFERRIRPLLVEHCYECHGGDVAEPKGGLRVDSLAGLARGGSSGAALVPGDPQQSLLLAALRYESFEMPPQGKLPDAVIQEFADWAAMLDERFLQAGAADAALPEASAASPQQPLWSLSAPQRIKPPEVRAAARTRGAVDAFVLAKLEAQGLTFAADANPRDLLRRLAYDLTGLPPTAPDVAAFAADPSDAAYAAAVERLMASPQFGERWARLWLDVARYADNRGYLFNEDREYRHAWKFRDWIVAALNADMPYDEFLVAQLAGDQSNDPAAAAPAAGFLTLGRRFLNNPHDIADDRIDVMTRGLMGLTVACARCHDHKYDPVPTADYYSLYGVLASSEERPQEELPSGLFDRPSPVEPVIFLRGSPAAPGPQVARRFLSCLAQGEPQPFTQGSGRLELARAIASPDNPLTARVWVNRLWGELLGRGIVSTPSDFGFRGEPPSHPELLDWLAWRLIDSGWSTKTVVRDIVLSSAYRQSTVPAAEAFPVGEANDPDNALLWHARRKRLTLEQFRDSLLVAAGRLDLAAGGPSAPMTDGTDNVRRSLYGYIDRQNLPAFFRTFDFANPNTHTALRAQTQSPHQALYLLNSPLVAEAACGLASRVVDNGVDEHATRQRIAQLFELALGRSAGDAELAAADAFLVEQAAADEQAPPSRSPWSYGMGRYDEASQHVDFTPLAHFTGSNWQAAPEFPHPEYAYLSWHAAGGHPGRPPLAAVLRFTSPAPGKLALSGKLHHPDEHADGVRLQLASSRRGKLGEWTAHHSESPLAVPAATIEAGEQLDLVVDCREHDAYDSFQLTVEISITGDDGRIVSFQSTDGFHGPEPPVLDRWQQLAQALLMSNEFMFLD